MVIGGAGSIGQAVTREIFRRQPATLHVVDISERKTEARQELREDEKSHRDSILDGLKHQITLPQLARINFVYTKFILKKLCIIFLIRYI